MTIHYRENTSSVLWPSAQGQDQHPTVHLLIVQPTPFCNLDCDYCYLPDRLDKTQLGVDDLARAIEILMESDVVGKELTFVWHAGEPLVVPPTKYKNYFKRINDVIGSKLLRVTHQIQTNATLINDTWCDLFQEYGVGIGVSIDGPPALHDSHRKTRKGAATSTKVLRGIDCLRRHGIEFSVISVLTSSSLQQPDEIWRFLVNLGPICIGFNVEELEGVHKTTSMSGANVEERLAAFFHRIIELRNLDKARIRIREIDDMADRIIRGRDMTLSSQTEPFAIISLDVHGRWSTFSPELLGTVDQTYGSFAFGDLSLKSISEIVHNDRYAKVAADIAEGKRKCQAECAYYLVCGGGAPANKLFEKGSFAVSETNFCRLHVKTVTDVVLTALEQGSLFPEIR